MEKVGESKHFELTACNGVSIYKKKEIDKGNDDEFNISVSISGSGEGTKVKVITM